jgi:hypothetical protein
VSRRTWLLLAVGALAGASVATMLIGAVLRIIVDDETAGSDEVDEVAWLHGQ